MKIFKNNLNWVWIGFAVFFIYGKYFVDTTEIAKLSSTISSYMWVLLGMLIEINSKISKIERR